MIKRLLPILALMMATQTHAQTWQDTVDAARGQTVYWHAWGGDPRTNNYIDWVDAQMQARFGIAVEHVPLTDTAEAVTRVLSERAAGQNTGGAVDLIWINGPNFLAMKEQDLLFGPFVQRLPNARFVDLSPDAPASVDFTVPVDGLEAPWRLAKFVFIHDSARVPNPPQSMGELLDWARDNPGRFTHPDPANFMGASFLKQALISLVDTPAILQNPVSEADYTALTAPLWAWYDALRPSMWREGETFPENESIQARLLNDGEIDITMSFDPSYAAAAINLGLLPDTARVFVPEGGTLGNISFVAIPYNAAHVEGAQVVADFLLSPEAQAQMQNIDNLGAFSVLDPALMDAEAAAFFADLPQSPALPELADLGPTLLEPHASWMTAIAEDWAARYAR
ncbi:ABC transporter substrate-binding protein [Rhodobacterales bacterium FZCC0188]|jgi:putative thiamine transport system substrate-binding protein|nr:ABC transporter substrate-binding protein [Rhodobacterales bacterium FZCC0188]